MRKPQTIERPESAKEYESMIETSNTPHPTQWSDVKVSVRTTISAQTLFLSSFAYDVLHFYFRGSLGTVLQISGRALMSVGAKRSGTNLIMAGARLGQSELHADRLLPVVAEIIRCFDFSDVADTADVSSIGKRVMILKKPLFEKGNLTEKGVLLVKFTEAILQFTLFVDSRRILRFFDLVFEPSWAGYALPEIVYWAKFDDGLVFVESADSVDAYLLDRIGQSFRPIRIGSGDWLDTTVFSADDSRTVSYDIVYVANYNVRKRLFRFFKLVHNLAKGRNYRFALICSSWGGNREAFATWAKIFRIDSHMDVYEDLSHPQLNDILSQTRIILLLSLREGSNRSLYEGMASGAVGIVLEENIGVNKERIESAGGFRVSDFELENEIDDLIANIDSRVRDLKAEPDNDYTPNATKILEMEIIRNRKARHEIWSGELAAKINGPEAKYMDSRYEHWHSKTPCLLRIFARNNDLSTTKAISKHLEKLFEQ